MTRDELLSQLHEEIALGFPAPFSIEDRAAAVASADGRQRVRLDRYLDLIAGLFSDEPAPVIPIRKEAA